MDEDEKRKNRDGWNEQLFASFVSSAPSLVSPFRDLVFLDRMPVCFLNEPYDSSPGC